MRKIIQKLYILLIGILMMVTMNMLLYSSTLDDTLIIYGWNILYLIALVMLLIFVDVRTDKEKLQDAYNVSKEEN